MRDQHIKSSYLDQLHDMIISVFSSIVSFTHHLLPLTLSVETEDNQQFISYCPSTVQSLNFE
jgi:hypothetical protein